MQLTLDDEPAAYRCHKCTRCFDTMSAVVRHSKRAHRPEPDVITNINFALENYCLVSTKQVVTVYV